MSDQTVDTPAVDTPAADQATSTPVQLQIQDLVLTAQVLQLVTQRGAIKAEEMEAVGGLYNRLVAFLQTSGALQPAQPDQPAEPADTSTTDAPAAPAAQ